MIPELYPHQSELVGRTREAMKRSRRVLMVLPTGGGKTVIFSFIGSRVAGNGKRVIIQAHRNSIVDQISATLDRFGVVHGRIQPGHSMTDDLVQVAMVQTLTHRIARVAAPDLIITDEAHHASANQYKAILEAWPKARSLGVTATPRRTDGRGLDECYDEMVIGPQMSWLIETGFLAKFTYLAPPPAVDMTGINKLRDKSSVDALADEMDKAVITGDAIEHYREYLGGRPSIAFCVNVKHAESVAAQFRAAGCRSQSIDGKMAPDEQRARLAALGGGGLNVLTSCQLIGEGTDIPAVAGVILLNPTKSVVNFLQTVGRALRVKADGSEAVILDHVGNVNVHGMPNAERNWTLDGKQKGEKIGAATCGKCFRAFMAGPGWKSANECSEGEPEGCIFLAKDRPADIEPSAPEVVPGKLAIVGNVPPWSDGLNIATARGPDFGELLRMADTMDKLKEIGKARGYHWKWAKHQFEARASA